MCEIIKPRRRLAMAAERVSLKLNAYTLDNNMLSNMCSVCARSADMFDDIGDVLSDTANTYKCCCKVCPYRASVSFCSSRHTLQFDNAGTQGNNDDRAHRES